MKIMKKYLMGGIAAVAICAAFTSCSKNNELFDQNAAEQAKQQTSEQKIISDYQTAFENAFGQPASNQDWGLSKYGSVNSAGTRAIIAEINDPFTNFDTNDLYETKIPTGAVDINTTSDYDCVQAGVLFAKEGMRTGGNKVNLWMAPGTGTGIYKIYIDGNVTIPTDAYIYNAKIYVLPKATLTVEKQANYTCQIFVADGGTLNYNVSKLEKNNDGLTEPSEIFNHGTVNFADNFEANQDVIIYNEGTMTGKDITSKPGDGHPSYFYNYGDLDLSGDLELNSCANFFNEGTVDVDGKTTCTQKDIWWINKGHYTTGTLEFSAHNETFYNYCNLIVEGQADFKDGKFHLMDNSYTETGNAAFGNSHFEIHMGNSAGINIKGNVSFAANGDGTDQGFFASGDKAYVRIDGKATVAAHKYSFVVDGKVVCAVKDGIEDLGASNSGVQPTYEFRNGASQVTDFTKLTVTPKSPTEGCGATWKGNPGGGITYQGRIMGEDLTAMSDNDFDFNDVVFDWAISKDKKTAYIKLLAAGGTLPLKIGTAVGEGQEVHELFKVGTGTMVNTGVGADGITKEPVEFTITTTGTFESAADIIVSVDKTSKGAQGYMQMSSKVGGAPCLLFVPLNTKWVDEYENIEKAYTWFKDYVGGTTDKWSEAPVEKYVNLILSDNK